MDYIGIANWREKATLLRSENFRYHVETTKTLTYDCERHLDFLNSYMDKTQPFTPQETLYYAYYKYFAGDPTAKEKSEQFVSQIKRLLKSEQFLAEQYIDVTDDGARLDGSHRAAIAHAIGIETLPVRIYRWENIFPGKSIGHIKRELALKRAARLEFQPSKIFNIYSGEYLGELAYVDFSSNIQIVQRWRLPKYFVSYKPVLAVKSPQTAFYQQARKLRSCPID